MDRCPGEKVSSIIASRIQKSNEISEPRSKGIRFLFFAAHRKAEGALAHPFSFLDLELKRAPHIMDVTAELLPRRLASLALGTGDLGCVYHFALPELREAVKKVGGESQLEMFSGMIDGRCLRDISDLPFDLAI